MMESLIFSFPQIIVIVAASLLFLVMGLKLGSWLGRKREEAAWKGEKLEEVVRSRLNLSRSVMAGHASEQLAPYFPDFPCDPRECRFLGKPVDIIAFPGIYDEKGGVEVVFIEVKSGKRHTLSKSQLRLREAIQLRRVRWVQYNLPHSPGS